MLYKVKIRWLTWPLNNIPLPWESLRFLLLYPSGQVILCFGLWYPMVQVILSSTALLWSCCFFLNHRNNSVIMYFSYLLCSFRPLGVVEVASAFICFKNAPDWLSGHSYSGSSLIDLLWFLSLKMALFISSSISMKNTNSTLVVVYGGKAAKCVFVQKKPKNKLKLWTQLKKRSEHVISLHLWASCRVWHPPHSSWPAEIQR